MGTTLNSVKALGKLCADSGVYSCSTRVFTEKDTIGGSGYGSHLPLLVTQAYYYQHLGSGSVTSFSSGNLSPLFTTSVATSTSTPALSFTLSTAAAHSFLGNNTNVIAAPAYYQPSFSDLAGNISVSQVNSGTGASSTTYYRGDGVWATPPSGTGTVTSLTQGFGILNTPNPITTSGTIQVDSSSVITKASQNTTQAGNVKYVDTLNSVSIATKAFVQGKNYLTTAVTSVATGQGLLGGTITTTGTLQVDSTKYISQASQNTTQAANVKYVDTSNSISIATKAFVQGKNYLTANQSITFTASNDISGSASGTTAISPSLTVTGIKGVSVPSLTAGNLKYTGAAWTFDNTNYLTTAVTSVATGQGLLGGTITTTGTLQVDSTKYISQASQNTTQSANVKYADTGSKVATPANINTKQAAFTGTSNIVTVGTISTGTWNGTTIAITNGGTGQTTANSALNALLPSQTGNNGFVLQTNGTNTSWVANGSGVVTAVSDNNLKLSSGTLTTNKVPQGYADAATITVDMNNGFSDTFVITANRTLAINNAVAGSIINIWVYQDGTGGHTLTVPNGTVTINPTASSLSEISGYYTGTVWQWFDHSLGSIPCSISSAAQGDIIQLDANKLLSRLAIGTSGQIPQSNGTSLSYVNNTGGWTELHVTGSDATTTGTTLVDITGLVTGTLSLNQVYEFEANLLVTTSAVTTGTKYGVNVSVSPTNIVAEYTGSLTSTTGATTTTVANNSADATAFLTTSAQNGVITIKGFFTTAGSGSPAFSVQHLKVTSGTSTVKIGSVLRYRKAQ